MNKTSILFFAPARFDLYGHFISWWTKKSVCHVSVMYFHPGVGWQNTESVSGKGVVSYDIGPVSSDDYFTRWELPAAFTGDLVTATSSKYWGCNYGWFDAFCILMGIKRGWLGEDHDGVECAEYVVRIMVEIIKTVGETNCGLNPSQVEALFHVNPSRATPGWLLDLSLMK